MILLGLNLFLKKYLTKSEINQLFTIIHIFGTQDTESIMCGFYCIDFIEYILAGKTLLNYTNLFSPNDYEKNDKIMYKKFKDVYAGRS